MGTRKRIYLRRSLTLLILPLVSQSYTFTFTPSFTSSLAGSSTSRNKACHRLIRQPSFLQAYSPSKVDEDDDPTPPMESDPFEIVDVDTIPGLNYDKNAHPIADQPWRRGDTDGCEDPIYAPWRQEAEQIIQYACDSIGAKIAGITWGMSQLIVSIDDVSEVEGIIDGPEIVVDEREEYSDEFGPDYFTNSKLSEDEFDEYISTHPRSQVEFYDSFMDDENDEDIDTAALSAVAGAIQEALQEPSVEERLKVLSRHELILTQPSDDDDLLDDQKDFDNHRGEFVLVETRDPFKSNRTLRGKLVARTALDIIINVEGNLVTIPQNFVFRVKLEEISTYE